MTVMQRALELAQLGEGFVEPNPMVGAVVVRDGVIVGEGYHARYGEAHAEVNALRHAGEAARGATLYVTLEPCCHHGKTPPCSDAVIRAGIVRVVAAMADPFPAVSGQGFARLRAAGIAVESGICEAEARRLNAPYLTRLLLGRPYVHLKWAMSLDGKTATRTGHSQWISGPESRAVVHKLRGRMDGILVGAGTLRADNPLLTARPPGPRTPARLVLSHRAELPADCQLLRTCEQSPVIAVGCTANGTADGYERLIVSSDGNGRADVRDLLQRLGERRWTNLLIEGGSDVAGAFLDAGCVDEVHAFIAPLLIGGATATPSVGGMGWPLISEATRCVRSDVQRAGDDVYWRGWLGSDERFMTLGDSDDGRRTSS